MDINKALASSYPNLTSKYKIRQQLGEGSFGVVYKATDRHTGEKVAIKFLKERVVSYDDDCLREVEVLQVLGCHPNIVKFKEMFLEGGKRLCLVYEYMQSNLLDVIISRLTNDIPFTESEIRDYSFQLLKGLEHTHANGFMHRDLKPANILVTKGCVKIADFGSATKFSPYLKHTDYVTTRWYRAPEVLFENDDYGSAVDMWALGAIMAEMYLLRPLFPGSSKDDQIAHISNFNEGIRYPEERAVFLSKLMPAASDSAIQLMTSLLSLAPNLRPTASEALRHSFFNKQQTLQPQRPSSSYWSSSCSQFAAPPLIQPQGLLV